MKQSIIIIGSILIVVNILMGLIISSYGCTNLIVSTFIIVLTTIILLSVNGYLRLKDGYKVSLNVIIPIIGAVEYLIGIFMPSRFSDNWGLIVLLILVAIESIILVAAYSSSTENR